MSITSAPQQRRQDIQGLRFVAVMLVVVYHVWLDRVSGGVDIFLALSAYFLTVSFTRRLESNEPLRLVHYWTRTFARIFPLATVTILGVVVSAPWLLPLTVWPDVQQQAVASTLYVQNWWLASNDVSYYGGEPIPLQHFWSLSIQGSVFLAWPVIFVLAAVLSRIRPWLRVRRLLAGLFATIGVASLAWSVWITATDQSFAYFDTRARLWEFAFGSLLALVATSSRSLGRPDAPWRIVLGWLGLAGILSVGVLVNVRDAFPGWIAVLPLAAAAAVVLVGGDPGRWGVGRLLGHPWLARLGDASYALYLVHWPILVAYVVHIDEDEPNLFEGGAIVAGSLVLAIGLHRLVERPLRRLTSGWKPWRDALLIVTSVALVFATVVGWQQVVRGEAERRRVEQVQQHPGARVLDAEYRAAGRPTRAPVPSIADLPHQWALAGSPCPSGWELPGRAQQLCRVLSDPRLDDTPGAAAPTADTLPLTDDSVVRVLLFGNSHVQHWSSAIARIAADRGWQVLLVYEQNCYLATPGDPLNTLAKCDPFWEDGLAAIEPLAPDVLVTVGTRSEYDGEAVLNSGLELLREHIRPGRAVIAMRDTPRFEVGLVQCDAARQDGDPPCEAGHPILDTPNPLQPLADEVEGLATLDLSPLVCPGRRCVPIIGNVRVWMDQHHLTRDYVETATDLLRPRLLAAIEKA